MFLLTLAVLAGVAYGVLLAALALGQDRFMYPAPGGGIRKAPSGWTMVRIKGLAAYHRPAHEGMPTVIFLHGNATDVTGADAATTGLAAQGIGILMPEYPGYGGNPGRPSEESLGETAENAHDWLTSRGVAARRIFLYGNSIGTGPAVHAARRAHGGLVLVSGVASMLDVVREHYPFVPGFLLRDHYENAAALRAVKGPALIIHARDDRVVPFWNGERLAKAADTEIVEMPAGDHFIAFDPAMSSRIAEWVLAHSTP